MTSLLRRLITRKHSCTENRKPLYGGGAHGGDRCTRCGKVFLWCYGNDHKRCYVFEGYGTFTDESK